MSLTVYVLYRQAGIEDAIIDDVYLNLEHAMTDKSMERNRWNLIAGTNPRRWSYIPAYWSYQYTYFIQESKLVHPPDVIDIIAAKALGGDPQARDAITDVIERGG